MAKESAELIDRGFYRFVREERHFCTILVQLLLAKGGNLEAFLNLSNLKLEGTPLITDNAEGAEIYTEFSMLRDEWKALGRDNDAKRARIIDLLGRAGMAGHVGELPESVPELNEFFMGPPGARTVRDVAYPGTWRVSALAGRFRDEPDQFHDLCRFKWAFNIKPDIVIVIPGSSPLSIEAKLESGEGQYPASSADRAVFDDRFGKRQRHVQQVDLQRFMFKELLGVSCEFLTLGARRVTSADDPNSTPFVTWMEAFAALDLTGSLDYVKRFVDENVYLNRK